MKQRKILVTGGAGFLGSFLCEKLVKSNHYVICCDNFFTGDKKNLKNIISNPNFDCNNPKLKIIINLILQLKYNFKLVFSLLI